MAELDNSKYAYRISGGAADSWAIEDAVGGFPKSFEGEGTTEYEVKTKVWSDSAFITTGASQFVSVTQPTGSLVSVPFAIERNGNVYRPDLSFNLRDYANITINNTYYVDSVDGNDAFDGLTINTPLKTLTAANNKGNANTLYLKRGSVWQKNQRPTDIVGNIEFIAYGAGNKPRITSLINNQIGTLTKTSNYWSGSAADFVANIADGNIAGPNGLAYALNPVASIALVNTTPGSFYWVASTIYVRLFDDREPDSLVDYYDALALRVQQTNTTQYFENVEFNGGMNALATASGGLKALFYKCDFKQFSNPLFWGCTPSIIQECTFNQIGGDAINIDDSNGIQGNHIEIDVISTNNNNGGPSSQASTAHNTSLVCRIGGQYFNTEGQCIADVNSANSWNMGMALSNSTAGVGFYVEGKTWVEGTNFGTSAKIITITSGSTFYHKNNSTDVIIDGSGSFVSY